MNYYAVIDAKTISKAQLERSPLQILCGKECYFLVRFGTDDLPLVRQLCAKTEPFFLWDAKRRVYKLTGTSLELQDFKESWNWRRRVQKTIRMMDNTAALDRSITAQVTQPTVIADGRMPLFFRHRHSIDVKPARARPFRYTLRSPRKKGSHPLLVYLHGAASFGTNGFLPLWEYCALLPRLLAAREPCHVLIPQANPLGPSPYSEDFMEDLDDAIDRIPGVDHSRIYLVGSSMGGCGLVVQCVRSPRRFAACVAAVPWLPNLDNRSDGESPFCKPLDHTAFDALAQTPLWLGYGRDENEWTLPLFETLKSRDADVRQTYLSRSTHNYAGTRFFLSQPWVKWLFSKQK